MLGAFAYFLTGEVATGTPETGSVAAGGLVMLILLQIADERDIQWLREWALGTACWSRSRANRPTPGWRRTRVETRCRRSSPRPTTSTESRATGREPRA